MRKFLIAGMAIAMLAIPSAASAYDNTAAYTGQGLNSNPDGFGGFDLNKEICGVENGADVDGPYLLFVMTATGAKNAEITFPSGTNAGTHAMVKSGGGTFKYIAQWDDPDALLASGITGTYDGKPKNVQLVVSHGCRPFNQEKPVWCSPGYWRNAEDAAWALTGHARSDLFNATVYDSFYGATFVADPTLNTVLTAPGGTYKGAGVSGTDPRTQAPFAALNAFNATGAYLSDELEGYTFSTTDYAAGSDTCPYDHHGNLKDEEVAPA